MAIFGHICRLEDTHLLKTLSVGIPEGNRPHGKPPKRWTYDMLWCGGVDIHQNILDDTKQRRKESWLTPTGKTMGQ